MTHAAMMLQCHHIVIHSQFQNEVYPRQEKYQKKETNERRNYLRNLDRRRVDDDVAVVSSVAVSPKSTTTDALIAMPTISTRSKHHVTSNFNMYMWCLNMFLGVQRGTKRFVNLAKHDPGRARQSS